MLDKEVLRDPRDFKAVYNKGKSKADRYVVVFYRPNGRNYNRICFLASKKVGNAVNRNRARRLMKESFRLMEDVKTGFDIIFIARNTIPGRKMDEVKRSMENAAKKAGLLNRENLETSRKPKTEPARR